MPRRAPYVPDIYRRDSRVSDAIRQRGANEARAIREQGNITAQMVAGVGGMIGGSLAEIGRARKQKPIDEHQARLLKRQETDLDKADAIDAALKDTVDPATGKPDLKAAAKAVSKIDPIEGLKFWQSAKDEEKVKVLEDKVKAEEVAKFAAGLLVTIKKTAGPMQQQVYEDAAVEAAQRWPDMNEQIPPRLNMAWLERTARSASSSAQLLGELTKIGEDNDLVPVVIPNAEGKPVQTTRTKGELRTNPAPVYERPTNQPTNLEDDLRAAHAKGDQREVQRILSLMRQKADAGRAPDSGQSADVTRAQKSQAERWKMDHLSKAEDDFTKATAQFTESGMAIPPELIRKHEDNKQAIQRSYEQQLGVPSGGGRPAPAAPPAPPPPAAPAAKVAAGTPAPPDLVAFLKGEPPGVIVLDDGSRWVKHSDGRIVHQ